MKLIEARLRSRMTNEMLGSLLNISINGPDTNSQECDKLVKKNTEKWLSGKRYKLAKRKSATKEPLKTVEPTLECTNVSTQTDNQAVDQESHKEVEQEEEQALIKLGLAQYAADDSDPDDSDRDSAMGESDFSDSDF